MDVYDIYKHGSLLRYYSNEGSKIRSLFEKVINLSFLRHQQSQKIS